MPAHRTSESEDQSRRDRWPAWLFSDKVWLAIVGAALTAATSYWLPWWLGQIAQQRDAQRHALDVATQAVEQAKKDRQQQAQEVTKKIDEPVLQRLMLTEFMVQLHRRHARDNEVRDAWADYWRSYKNFFVFLAGNEVPADRLTVNGPQAQYLDQHPVLWTYLTKIIAPEFDRIHYCLVLSDADYSPRLPGKDDTPDSEFQHCLASGSMSNAFWIKAWDSSGAVDPWGRFKDCVGTFLIQIQYGLEWREQLAEEESAVANSPETKLAQCPPGYTGDQWCRQMRYNRDVYQQMTLDCGPLSGADVAQLDLLDGGKPGANKKQAAAGE